ncbi:hypothetical protein, partial [Escherichia coli]|uniref:hypothetical protein n=1 Tax=Escherichia coli TaxID=562 RepID=UPI0015C36220
AREISACLVGWEMWMRDGYATVVVKEDDSSRAGTVLDDAVGLGGYLVHTHTSSGLWADNVAKGTRNSMKASSDHNDFRAR